MAILSPLRRRNNNDQRMNPMNDNCSRFETRSIKKCYFNATLRARTCEVPFYLNKGPLYGWYKQQTDEIKQAKRFKRYTCHVVKKIAHCQY